MTGKTTSQASTSAAGPAVARFLELCLDVTGTDGAMGRFWSAVTGLTLEPDVPEGPGNLVGDTEGHGIALCPVPEAKTVKHRVHLDLHTDSVDSLAALGATVLRPADETQGWTVMADPEGGEFCAFVRPTERLMSYRVYELVVDCRDPERLARWWAEIFGVEAQHEAPHPWWWLEGVPGMPFEAWVFGAVPEAKTVKNRLHWDVYGQVQDFVDRGAEVYDELPRWTVMTDPESNEFCVFPPR